MTGYLKTITTASALFPLLALLITIPFMIYNYNKYGSISKWRFIIVYSFVLYILVAYFLTILPLPSREYVSHLTTARYNFNIWRAFTDFKIASGFNIHDASTYISTLEAPTFYQPAFNILLTLPFGIYLRYYGKCSLSKTIVMTFCLSLFFELTQLSGLYGIYSRSYRLFDVDDLLFNTIGGFVGYGLGYFAIKLLPNRDEIDNRAYKEGEKVSGLRRLVALFIDYVTYVSVSAVVTMIYMLAYFKVYISTLNYIRLLVAFFLFVLLPLFFDDRTIGKRIVQIKVSNTDGTKVKWYKLLLRNLLFYILIFIIPNISWFNDKIILLLFRFIVIIYYLTSGIKACLRKPLWYERITKTTDSNTIIFED